MPPDVILVQCDTARADAFRPWGAPDPTPAMQRLAAEGVIYTHAVAPAPWTLASTASIFSGRFPSEHGVSGDAFTLGADGRPTSPADAVRACPAPWLPDTLRDRGYRTWAASCNTWISRWGGFDRGFDRFLDVQIEPGDKRKRLQRILGRADWGGRKAIEELVRELRSGDRRPLFAYVNLMEVHAPYDPPRRFHPLFGGNPRPPAGALFYQLRQRRLRARATPAYLRAIRSLYAACARYEDWLLGLLVRAVGDGGRPAAVAIVSDHGENLGEHGLFAHHSSLHETLLRVPLALWGHGLDVGEGRVDAPVSLQRVAAWIRATADGSAEPIRPDEYVVSEYESTVRHMGVPAELRLRIEAAGESAVPELVFRPGVALRAGSLKYIAIDGGSEWVHDLEKDPSEKRNVGPQRPDLLGWFRPHRLAWEARRAKRPIRTGGEVADEEIVGHLKALGYID